MADKQKSKRFTPARWMRWLVPFVLIVLLFLLLITMAMLLYAILGI